MGFFKKIKNMVNSENDLENVEDDRPISLKNNTIKRNFKYLQDLINNSNQEVITLDADITLDDDEYTIFKDGIKIDEDNIIIEGNGFSIDAKNKTRIITNNAKNIYFKNVSFINSKHNLYAGAINNNGKINFVNCNFNRYSSPKGGAIKNNGVLNLKNCNFINDEHNISFDGGTIFNDGEGCIIDCKFQYNFSTNFGGSIFNSNGKLIFKNCCFENNNSVRNGGAIYNNASIIFQDCFFKENLSKNYGGVIDNRNHLNLINCIFDNNIAKYGGAIYNDSLNELTTIIKSSFNSNSVYDYSFIDDEYSTSCKGGAIYNENGLVNVENSNFIKNFANYGACIFNEDTFNFKECAFKNNGGIYHADAVNVLINNGIGAICKYASIYNNDAKMKLNNCTFEDNTAEIVDDIINFESTTNKKSILNLNSCIFKNYLTCEDFIKIENSGFLQCEELIFENKFSVDACIIKNTNFCEIFNSNFKDGHIISQENANALNIANSIFSSEIFKKEIIYIGFGFCVIKNTNFITNNDGFVITNDGVLELITSKFDHNNEKIILNNNVLKIRADDDIFDKVQSNNESNIKFLHDALSGDWKGFRYLEEEVIQKNREKIILDCDIRMHENEQDFYEGGIEIDKDNLIIDGQGHTIDSAGLSRIFYVSGNNITLKNIIFKNGFYFKNYFDNSSCGGGAICILHNSSVHIENCEFLNNKSELSAGAIINKGDLLNINESNFKDNFSKYNGGSICNVIKCPVVIHNSNFYNNIAGSSGGAIFDDSFSSLDFKSCIFEENVAESSGGALFFENINFNLIDCNFNENISKNGGGGIHMCCSEKNNNVFNLSNCSFENNNGMAGFAIFNEYYNLNLLNCNFFNNKKLNNGKFISTFMNKGKNHVKFQECTFHNNEEGLLNFNNGVIDLNNCIFESTSITNNFGNLNFDKCEFLDVFFNNELGFSIFYDSKVIKSNIKNYSGEITIKYCIFKDLKEFYNRGVLNILDDEKDIFDNLVKNDGSSTINIIK